VCTGVVEGRVLTLEYLDQYWVDTGPSSVFVRHSATLLKSPQAAVLGALDETAVELDSHSPTQAVVPSDPHAHTGRRLDSTG
jgi:hypothetical protein